MPRLLPGAFRSAFLLSALLLFALARERAEGVDDFSCAAGYFPRIWGPDEGFHESAVTCVMQARDGYLWLGTYNGLVRFDGVRFVTFDTANTKELSSNRVTSLFQDSDGVLWIGHETGELTRRVNGRFEAVSVPLEGVRRSIIALAQDAGGDLWLMRETGAASRVRDGLRVEPSSGVGSGSVEMSQAADGQLWILRGGQVARLLQGEVRPFQWAAGSLNQVIKGLGTAAQGGVWLVGSAGAQLWKDGHWERTISQALPPDANVIDVTGLNSGAVAVGTSNYGLFILSNECGLTRMDRRAGLPSDWVRNVFEDEESNLWLGAGAGGLVRIRASRVLTLQPPDEWNGSPVKSISASRDGGLWIATEGSGIYKYKDGLWTNYDDQYPQFNPYSWSVAEDATGALWVGTWSGGVSVLRDESFARPDGLRGVFDPIKAILHTSNDGTWIGTLAGLIHSHEGTISRVSELNGQEIRDVRALVLGPDGTLWFGMAGGGLGSFKQGHARRYGRQDGLGSDFVQCLLVDREGALWIGTSGGGLTRYKEGGFSTISTEQGLPSNVLCHLEEDASGHLWASSQAGVFRARKADLDAVAEGRRPSFESQVFGRADGLPTPECAGGVQPAGCKSSDGLIWFATPKGPVAINPAGVEYSVRPPPGADRGGEDR